MQAQANARMLVQRAHKWRVGFLVRLFDHLIEVSHRLVRMDDKSERNFTQFFSPFWQSRALQKGLE
jgi:hypothetical protein